MQALNKAKKAFKNAVILILLLMITLSSVSMPVLAITGEDVVAKAKTKLGCQYILGAAHSEAGVRDPNTSVFDCSSFVSWTFTQLGHYILGTTHSWTNSFNPEGLTGESISTTDQSLWQPGDVLLTPGHVVIYQGGGQIIHASNPTSGVIEGPVYGELVSQLIRVWRATDGIASTASGGSQDDVEDLKGYNIEEAAVRKSKFFYEGTSKGKAVVNGKSNIFLNLVFLIKDILSAVLGALLYILRMVMVGWVTIFENIITTAFESVINKDPYIKRVSDLNVTLDRRRIITIENILANRVEVFNIDFFRTPSEVVKQLEGRTATGQKIQEIDEKGEKGGNEGNAQKYGERGVITEEDYENSLLGTLRASLSSVYVIMLLISITILFVILLITGIRGIRGVKESSASGLAEVKQNLIIWAITVGRVLLNIFILVLVIKLNSYIIAQIGNLGITSENKGFSFIDQVRTRVYEFPPLIGFSALIVYFLLVLYTVKYIGMYLKRLLIVGLLIVVGPIIPVYSAIRNILGGADKGAGTYKQWMKELLSTVFLQVAQYAAYISVSFLVLNTLEGGIAKAVLTVLIFREIFEITKKIQNYFGVGSSTILNNLTNTELITRNNLEKGIALWSISRSRLTSGKMKKAKEIAKSASIKMADTAIIAGYNTVQRAKEKRQEENPQKETKHIPIINDSINNEEILEQEITEQEAKKVDNLENIINMVEENKQKIQKRETDIKVQKPKTESMKDILGSYIYVDDKGRKRMIPARRFYDNQTQIMTKEAGISERFARKMKKAITSSKLGQNSFGLASNTFAIGKTSAKILGVMAGPMLIISKGNNDIGSMLTLSQVNILGDNKNLRKEGKIRGILNLESGRYSAKYSRRDVKKIVENLIKNAEILNNVDLDKKTGIEELEEIIKENRKRVSARKLTTKERDALISYLEEVGNIKDGEVSLKAQHKLEIMEAQREAVNLGIDGIQAGIIMDLNKDMNLLDIQIPKEEILEVKTIQETKDSLEKAEVEKNNNLLFVKKEKMLSQNITNIINEIDDNSQDVLKTAKLVSDKVKAEKEYIDNLVSATKIQLKDLKVEEVTEDKVLDAISKTLTENMVENVREEYIPEVKNEIIKNINEKAQREQEIRDSEIEFTAKSLGYKEKQKNIDLLSKDLSELTLEELDNLLKYRIMSNVEGYKLTESIKDKNYQEAYRSLKGYIEEQENNLKESKKTKTAFNKKLKNKAKKIKK